MQNEFTGVLGGPLSALGRGVVRGLQTTWKGATQVKRYMVGPVAVLSVCLAAGLLYAGYDQSFGEIKSIDLDAGKLVVAVRMARDEEPKEVTYVIDKDTTVRIGRDREKKALTDLVEGKRASIVYKEAEKEGDLPTALLITVWERRRRGGQ